MKVCVITTSFPRFSGDYAGIFISRLCRALVSLNIKIDVVAPSDGNEFPMESIDGFDVFRFQYFFPRSLQILAYGPGGIPANLKRNPSLFIVLPFFILFFFFKTLGVSKKADLIHAHWLYTGVVAVLIKKIRNVPFILTLRGSDVLRAEKGGVAFFVSRWVIHHAAFITTVNRDLKNWVVRQGYSHERVHCIRNGVDLNEINKNETNVSHCRFIFVGSLVPGKGVRYLIQALSLVYQVEKKIRLTVVGDGEEISTLKLEVEKSGLDPVVDFLGVQKSEYVSHLMKQADCLVLPSLSEGTPNVVLEAMGCGLPIVATDLPGIREVVEEKVSGFLVEPKNVDALAKKMLHLVQNIEDRLAMGRSAYQSILKMRLGWDQSAKQYLEVYKKACAVSQDASI